MYCKYIDRNGEELETIVKIPCIVTNINLLMLSWMICTVIISR